jgi:DNA-binding NtrC family response regulator
MLDFLQWFDHQNAQRTPDTAPKRLFFSTSQPLRRLTAAATLRIDLAHRISAIRFVMPPLRERRDDIALLADRFARRFAATHGKPVRGLGPQTLPKLLTHTWPGNVRELESVISTAALDCEGQWIRPIDLPSLMPVLHVRSFEPSQASGQSGADLNLADPNLDSVILRHIQRILTHVDGNKLRAARMLGISRSTLYRLLENKEQATAPAMRNTDHPDHAIENEPSHERVGMH